MLVEFALYGAFVSSIKCHLMLEEHPSPMRAQATFSMPCCHPNTKGERGEDSSPSHLDQWTSSWLYDVLRHHRTSQEMFVNLC